MSGESGVSHGGMVGLGSDEGVHFHFVGVIGVVGVWMVVALGRLGFESRFGLLGARGVEHVVLVCSRWGWFVRGVELGEFCRVCL